MTVSLSSDRSPGRPRRDDLMSRTAIMRVLACLSTILAQPAYAVPVMTGAQASGGGPAVTADSGVTGVALHSPRTIITWSSFDVGAGESVNYTFDSRDWIVLNKITTYTPPQIDGTITGKVGGAFGGNVWFTTPSGMIFGAGSQFDAGGILVATASPDSATFLDPSKSSFDFSGGEVFGSTSLALMDDARITTHGGLLALIAPSVTSEAASAVSAQDGASVLYGAAGSYKLTLSPGAGGDFDLVDFIVPNAPSGSTNQVAVDLQGSTSGNSVFVAVVSHTSFASAVINLEGMVTAQSAATDGGDVVLSGGGGIVGRLPGPTVSGGADTDIYLSTVSASRDVRLKNNTGTVYGRPWLRPPKPLPDEPVVEDNGFGNTFGNGCGNNCGGQLLSVSDLMSGLLAAADPTILSSVNAARDIRMTATGHIDLGVARATGDLSVQGASLTANSLGATGALTATTTGDAAKGNLIIAAAGVGGAGAFTSSNDIEIGNLGLVSGTPQWVTINAAEDVNLTGGGTAGGSGVIDVTAGRNVSVDLSSASLGTVTAVGDAVLRGGSISAISVTGQKLLARADSIDIGSATSASDVYIVSLNGDATVGNATAGDDVFVIANNGTASLTSATLTGLAPDVVSYSLPDNPDANDNGRVVNVTSNLDASLGLGTGSVTGATAVGVQATQDAFVDLTGGLPGTFSETAGRDASLKAPSVSLDLVSAGRDLSIATSTGDFTVTQALVATRNISIGAAGALKVGDVTAGSGSITLTGSSVTGGAVNAAQDLSLKALTGGVQVTSYSAGRDLTLQGASFSLGASVGPVGRDLAIITPGDLTITNDLTATRNINLTVNGKATLGNLTAAGVDIVANDLDFSGAITAPTIQIESLQGPARVGGSASDGAFSGLWLDNAEFGRLRASTEVKFYAGPALGTARGDLTVLALNVNPAFTPLITLLAGSQNNVLVQGAAGPSASGGALRIGDPTLAAWRPGSILVTGSIGTATFSSGAYNNIRAFDDVQLRATNDILMGSQRFITLIQTTAVSDIDLGAGKPTGVGPTGGEQLHLFTVAGKLEVSAAGKVVQQNTGPSLSSPVGVLITSKGSPDLIIDPPQTVQLFGAVIGLDGKLVSSFGASNVVTVAVVDSSGAVVPAPAGASYTFNTCTVGTSQCSGSASLLLGSGSGSASGLGAFADGSVSSGAINVAQTAPILSSPEALAEDDDGGGNPTKQAADGQSALAVRPPPLLAVAPVDLNEIVSDPVTIGSGSEEIWRKNRAKK
jgi:filamentous hemagglutinin family protein